VTPANESKAAPAPADFGGGDEGAPAAEPGAAPSTPMAQGERSATITGDVPRQREEVDPNRPGLGTEWGETRSSRISSAPFTRADPQTPFAMASLFYNDADGARAMANVSGFRTSSQGSVDIGNGIATLSLKDTDTGRFLSGFEAGSKDYVVGSEGQRYTIVIENHVDSRLELVVSVDGLDVLDGKPASFAKRGYLIDPRGTVEIDGFRTSMDEVAAFKFGSVRNSYAEQKHGDSRNVGVIGVALFNEMGTNPLRWSRGEVDRRMNANPFPGQFATPPGR
jgi:hypothetical protein